MTLRTGLRDKMKLKDQVQPGEKIPPEFKNLTVKQFYEQQDRASH